MPARSKILVMGACACALLAFSGCGRKTASKPLPVEQVPQAIESAFKNASPDASQAARDVVSSVRSDEPNALAELQDLSVRGDLNEQQRIAAARALAAYLQKLRDTAAKGDKKSEEALENYRATK